MIKIFIFGITSLIFFTNYFENNFKDQKQKYIKSNKFEDSLQVLKFSDVDMGISNFYGYYNEGKILKRARGADQYVDYTIINERFKNALVWIEANQNYLVRIQCFKKNKPKINRGKVNYKYLNMETNKFKFSFGDSQTKCFEILKHLNPKIDTSNLYGFDDTTLTITGKIEEFYLNGESSFRKYVCYYTFKDNKLVNISIYFDYPN